MSTNGTAFRMITETVLDTVRAETTDTAAAFISCLELNSEKVHISSTEFAFIVGHSPVYNQYPCSLSDATLF